MAGVKGMHHKKPEKSLRRNIWRSMRILRQFTRPDLMRTVPGATDANIWQFLSRLVRHGIVAKNGKLNGGRPGEYQQYRLVKDYGPEYPTVCPACKQPLSKPCKKTDEETETDTVSQGETP